MTAYSPTTVSLTGKQTGTGVAETFVYQLPPGYDPGSPPPVLICWHSYSRSYSEIEQDSDFFQACMDKGWIFVAMTAYDQSHFACMEAQRHTSLLFPYLFAQGIAYDASRVYMAGFSMGAAAALSYACRNIAIGGTYRTIAGVIAIAPVSSDMAYGWQSGDAGASFFMVRHYGGGYNQHLITNLTSLPNMNYRYEQLRPLKIQNGIYNADGSLIRNCACGTGIYIAYALDDDEVHDNQQNEYAQLKACVEALCPTNSHVEVVSTGGHAWDIVAASDALDYIENFDTDAFERNDIDFTADRNGKWHWVTITKSLDEVLCKVIINADVATNTIDVDYTYNLIGFEWDTASAGMAPTGSTMYVNYNTATAGEVEIVLTGIDTEPTSITDDGSPFTDWSYDADEDELTITRATSSTMALTINWV